MSVKIRMSNVREPLKNYAAGLAPALAGNISLHGRLGNFLLLFFNSILACPLASCPTLSSLRGATGSRRPWKDMFPARADLLNCWQKIGRPKDCITRGIVFQRLLKCHREGFTLVELIVSIAIFVVFLGVMSTSYIGIVRAQRQANETRRAISEARAFMETLAQDFRSGTIDYDCYAENNVNCPVASESFFSFRGGNFVYSAHGRFPYLALANGQRDEKTVYWYDAERHKLKVRRFEPVVGAIVSGWLPKTGYQAGIDDTEDGWRTMFSDNVKIEQIVFELGPPLDPYSSKNYDENQYQFQPRMTLFMTLANGIGQSAPFRIDLQTGFSSRVYSRNAVKLGNP